MMTGINLHKYRGFIVLLFVGVLFASGCTNESLLKGDRTQQLYRHPRFHTVESGDTLYSIAWTYGYDYRVVAKWNNIKPPYTIRLGQRIRIAPPPEFDARKALSGMPSFRTGKGKGADKDTARTLSQEQSKKNNKKYKDDSPLDWQWPVEGKVVKNFSASGNGSKGVDIVGNLDQPVYAAADGEVVYSGRGLRGYGNLIIIKHNDLYLSAYAHNKELLVKEGQRIVKGNKIATMGNSDTDKVMLHFEIRRDGKPVDPLAFLPKRDL